MPGIILSIYVNGVASGSGAVPGFVQVGNRPAGDNPGPYAYTYDGAGEFVFGWRADADWKAFPGSIDDVAIYSKALTAGQVQSHYMNQVKLTISKPAGNIVLSWPFGTLQASPNADTGYTNVLGATSPYTNAPSAATLFYRVQTQP